MVTTSRRSSGQDTRFGGLGMANSKSGDYKFFSSGQVLEFRWWPQCWFHKIEISAMYSYIPLGFNQLLNVGVDQWFHICIVNTCQWVYILVYLGWGSLLLVGPLISINATVACLIVFEVHRSNFKVTAKKIVDIDPKWTFPDSNPSVNSPMALKRCTKLVAA